MKAATFSNFRFLAGLLALFSTFSLFAASLTVEFRPEPGKPTDYDEVNVYVLSMARPSLDEAIKHSSKEKSFEKTFKDLEPGRYMVLLFTGPFDQVNDASKPGAFRTQRAVQLAADDSHEKLVIDYQHLDPSQYRGDLSASGRVLDPKGRPVPDTQLKVVALVEHAGNVLIAEPKTGSDGSFQVSNLAKGFRYFVLDANGTALSQISPNETVRISLPPQVGGTAPDVEFVQLSDGKKLRLSDFKGKVVVLEFWATWCGPCQEPMAKMQTYKEKHPEWGDKVELIALSVDDTRTAPVNHLKARGWDKTLNAWAGPEAFQADAPQTYGVTGIPAMFVIDQKGVIAATGHPMGLDVPEIVSKLLTSK